MRSLRSEATLPLSRCRTNHVRGRDAARMSAHGPIQRAVSFRSIRLFLDVKGTGSLAFFRSDEADWVHKLPNLLFTLAGARLACFAGLVALQRAGPLSACELLPAGLARAP